MAKLPALAHHRWVTRAMRVVTPVPLPATGRSPVATDTDAAPRQVFPVPVLAAPSAVVVPVARTTAVVRRVYDPAIDNGNRQAGLTYIANNAARIIGAFQGALNSLRIEAQGPTTVAKTGAESIGVALRTMVDRSNQNYLPAAHLLLNNTQPAAQHNEVTALAVRVLNYMEAETATAQVTGRAATDIHVGTEFSFSDGLPGNKPAASINLKLIAPDKRTEQQKKPHVEANRRIGAWTEKARTSRDLIPGRPLIQTSQKNGAKAEYAVKVTYTFNAGQPNAWTWWWVADIDEGCYETQTMPSPISKLQEDSVKTIISEHIFGLAKAQELKPDASASGGGGHISVDLGSAFGWTDGNGQVVVSFEALLGTLVDLQNNAEQFQQQVTQPHGEGGQQGDVDPTNAPWLSGQTFAEPSESTPLAEFRKLASDVEKAVAAGDGVTIARVFDQLTAFNKRLRNLHDTGTRRGHLEDPDNISHYQAVNVEHLVEPPPDPQDLARHPVSRIELRDIPAQTSHAKLVKDLTTITDIVTAVRRQIHETQKARLGYL